MRFDGNMHTVRCPPCQRATIKACTCAGKRGHTQGHSTRSKQPTPAWIRHHRYPDTPKLSTGQQKCREAFLTILRLRGEGAP
jgi:hypothetical protein